MAENVTSHAFRVIELHRKWVGVVVDGRRHRQPDHDPGPFVEYPWGENDERVHVLHLARRLGIAINPDHVASIRAPRFPPGHYRASLPTRPVAITSPPCSSGSNAANFCSSVSFGSPIDLTSTLES